MSEWDEQLAHVCAWNRQLASETVRLRAQLCRAQLQIRELQEEVARVQAERDAIDTALGASIDEALAARRS